MAETTVLRSSAVNRTPNGGAAPRTQLSGALPVVNVNMNSGGPSRQGGQMVRQGVTILPPKGGTAKFSTGGLPNQPAKQSVVISAPKDPRYALQAAVANGAVNPAEMLTADQLMLCRHLVDKYLGDLRKASDEAEADGATGDNIKLAEAAIITIDAQMAALTAAAAAAAAPPPPPRIVTGGPRQVAAGAGPRRVARPAGPPPPPVVVRMDGGTPQPVDPTDAPQDPPAA